MDTMNLNLLYWHFRILSDADIASARFIFTKYRGLKITLEELYFRSYEDAVTFFHNATFYWPWTLKDQEPAECRVVGSTYSDKEFAICDSSNPAHHAIIVLECEIGVGPTYVRLEDGKFIFNISIINEVHPE